MRFKTRLVLGHAALVGVSLMIGATAVIAMRTTTDRLDTVARDLASDVIAIERLRFQTEQLVATSRGYLLTGDPGSLRKFDDAAERVEATLSELAPRARDVERAARQYVEIARQGASQRTSTDDPRAIVPFFEKTLGPVRDRFEQVTSDLVRREQSAFESASRGARASAGSAKMIVTLGAAMAILISTVLTLVSIRKLNAHYAREQEATELARRAVGARDELLAIVSHDLRTPVQAIAIAANILSETGVSAAGRRPLTTIANATERMQYLIDELLEAAKFESGTFQLQRELCVASDMLDTTFSLFGERAARAGIALLAGKGSHREVSVDRERLLQVLSNLVSNAFKFTPAGGRVILSTEECGSSTKFVVEDTGSGISDDDVRHLFERYWQGRAKHRGSLGLGLYICGQIVNAHGGEIGVETRLGQGSTFWFTVPNSIS